MAADEHLNRVLLPPIERRLADNARWMEQLAEGADDGALKNERAELICQRSEAACRRIQIYALLEKARSIRGDKRKVSREQPACAEYGDFLRWSNGDKAAGKVTAYSEAEAFRYIKLLIIHSDRFEVIFKAGVSIAVTR